MKNIAIVGCGGMGSGHAIAIASGTGNAIWAELPVQTEGKLQETDSDLGDLLHLAGICDIDPDRVRWAKERGYRIYDCYQDILDDPAVDIVLIATPNHLHKDEAILAMRAGKHVLCEKPVMMNSAELEEVMAVAAESGKVFYPRQNRRWDKDYMIVKKILQDGMLGKVFSIECRVQGSRGIPGDWRAKKEFGGGMMLDWGVHLLDRLLAMVPEKVTHVFCDLTHVTTSEVDDGFKLHLTFESGLTASVEVGTCHFAALPLWFVAGEHGTAVIDNWECTGKVVRLHSWEDKDAKPILAGAGLTKTMAPRGDGSVQELPLPEVEYDNNELYVNLLETIDGKAAQIVTNDHALRVLRLMETAVRSSETHSVLAFETHIN